MLNGMLAATAAARGDATALVWRGQRISWRALAGAVGARAAHLAEAGVGPGDALAILLPNSPDFVAWLLAAASLGAVAVPLAPGLTGAEVAESLRGCRVGALVGGECAAALARGSRPGGVPFLASDGGLPSPAPPSRAAARRPVPGQADALYGFSTGTTGPAKRFARSQANLAHEAGHFTAALGLGPGDAILGVAPFFHAHGLGNCVLAALSSGAALVIEERFDPRTLVERIREERVTVFPGVPFMFRMLAEGKAGSPADLASLRVAFSAGAPLPREVFDAFDKRFGRPVRQLYGCSEAGSICINLDAAAAETWDSVGRPMPGVELGILGEDGTPRAPGEAGRIAIRSPALTGGYHGAEAPGRPAFRDGWFEPGDLGFVDERGLLRVTGRVKLFVSTAAGKVDPAEVERCIEGLPEVREVVVVGVPGRGGDERVKAAVVPHAAVDEAVLRREIIARCREQLAEHKIPRIVEIRAEIPRSALGKVLRRQLVAAPPQE